MTSTWTFAKKFSIFVILKLDDDNKEYYRLSNMINEPEQA